MIFIRLVEYLSKGKQKHSFFQMNIVALKIHSTKNTVELLLSQIGFYRACYKHQQESKFRSICHQVN